MFRPTVFILCRSKRRSNWSALLDRRLTALGVPVWRATPNALPKYSLERVKLVINYGTGTTPIWWDRLPDDCVILNAPEQVDVSAHKIRMQDALPEGHRLPYFTTKVEAQEVIDAGGTIVSRTLLKSHSGRGIVLSPYDELPEARLYTQLIHGDTIKEYRLWFGPEGMLDVAQKKRWRTERLREAGIDPEDYYARMIQAWDNGWVFAHLNMACNNTALFSTIVLEAQKILTWGCVDVLIDHESENWWIVETNSAPGMASTRTTDALLSCFMNQYEGVKYA